MKKALNLLIAYLITLVTGTLVGSVLYSFYISVLKYVAGTEVAFFAKNDMFYAIFYILFCVLIIICPLISYYRIRHPGGVPQIIAFVILALLTWTIFIPSVFKLSNKYTEEYYVADKPVSLSKGYFRKVDDKVYYFTDDFTRNSKSRMQAYTVEIDLKSEFRNVTFKTIEESEDHPLFTAASPYRDVLLKNTMTIDEIPTAISFTTIIKNEKDLLYGDFLTFIGYLSLGLALAAVFSLTNVFNWKLINTLLISLSTVLILMINSLPSLFGLDILTMKMAHTGFIKFFSKFGNPLVVFLNFFLAFAYIATGVIVFLVKRHGSKNK